MADNQHRSAQKPGMSENPRRNQGKDQPIVGKDVPDESKERQTEVAVEAGRRQGARQSDKS